MAFIAWFGTFLNAIAFIAIGDDIQKGGFPAMMAYASVLFILILIVPGSMAYHYRALCHHKRWLLHLYFYMQIVILALFVATFYFVITGGQ